MMAGLLVRVEAATAAATEVPSLEGSKAATMAREAKSVVTSTVKVAEAVGELAKET